MARSTCVSPMAVGCLMFALLQASCAGRTEADKGGPSASSGGLASGGATGGASSGGADAGAGGSVAGAGGQDTGGAGSGGTSYRTEDFCFDPSDVEACDDLAQDFRELGPFSLFDANDLGADARFLGVDSTAAWLELTEQDDTTGYRVVSIAPTLVDGQGVFVHELDFPEASGPYELRHAWSGHLPSLENGLAIGQMSALVCDQEKCMVLTGSFDDKKLSTLSNTELPADTQRLSFAVGVPCAFGSRVDCWNGTAFEPLLEMPEGAGTRFTHFSLRHAEDGGSGDIGFAVTDQDAVLVTDSAGLFQLILPAGAKAIRDVESNGWEYTVLFEDGDWWLGRPGGPTEPATDAGCFEPGVMQYLVVSSLSEMQIIDSEGVSYLREWVFENREEGGYKWCRSTYPVVEGLLDVSAETCGLALNVFAITEKQLWSLWGPPTCPIG